MTRVCIVDKLTLGLICPDFLSTSAHNFLTSSPELWFKIHNYKLLGIATGATNSHMEGGGGGTTTYGGDTEMVETGNYCVMELLI